MTPHSLTGKRGTDIRTIDSDWKAQAKALVGIWPDQYTEDQKEIEIRHLATLPLTRLRQGQSIVDEQIGMAYEQKNEKATTALQAHRELLDDAVMRSEFGDLQHVKGKRLKDYEHRAHGVGPVLPTWPAPSATELLRKE